MRSRARAAVAGAALTGLLVGVAVTLAVTEPRTDAAGTGPRVEPPAAPPSTTSPPATTSGPQRAEGTLLVWTSGGLPPELAADVTAVPGVDAVTVVQGDQTSLLGATRRNGTVALALDGDWAIPLDTLAVEPDSFSPFVAASSRAAVDRLQPGAALLTDTSRRLRGLDVGDRIGLRGASLEITGIVDDVSGAGAELIVHRADAAAIGAATDRYLLLHHRPGAREPVTDAIDELTGDRTIRFRSATETTWLRHGDAVAPQVFVKRDFGEFAFRDRPGREIEIDPGWVEANIVEGDLSILGSVRCHRSLLGPLGRAMRSLTDDNLGHLVDPGAFAGCWSPRRIADGEPLSRHAWGIAVDLNIDGNPRGSFSSQDPRLVEAMRSNGFTWGGTWLVPDPGHYELVPPASAG